VPELVVLDVGFCYNLPAYFCVQYLYVVTAFRYVISDHERTLLLDCITESDKEKLATEDGGNTNTNTTNNNKNKSDNTENATQPHKKQKLSKGEKKRLRGQNKARPLPFKYNQETSLCRTLIDVAANEDLPVCNNHKCSFLHDISAYLAAKPPDLNSTCYVYSTQGRCPRGASCRYV
jgi:hypothetical protein